MQLEFHQLDQRWQHLRARDPQRQRRLLASLAEAGQQTPIVVVLAEDNNTTTQTSPRYLVIDGHNRIAALRYLGRDTVEATVWSMSEGEALLLDRTSRLSRQETALELGWLLLEMEQRYSYSIEELAQRFDRSTSWISRRLALVELLPEAIQQQVREGTIAAQLAMKYLVPVARRSVEDCQRMAAAFASHRWNTREAGQLYMAWREGSRLVRERILDAPELFLKTQRQGQSPSPAGTEATALQRDLETAAASVQRASRRLATALSEMDGKQRDQAQHKIGQARRTLERMAQQMEQEKEQEQEAKEEPHAEPGTTSGDSGDGPARSEQTRDCAGAETVAAQRTQSAARQHQRCPTHHPPGESRTAPPTDPRSVERMQGESRASP
jgi:ParB family chromosome partitioning protein